MDINATLIGQLLTFILLTWFTMKYVWPPIMSALAEREKKIAEGIAAAERSQRELLQTEASVSEILQNAKLEANQIIDQGHKRSTQLLENAKENARAESQRILEQAQDEIVRQVSQAKEELRKQVTTLAIAGAEKIIKKNLDAQTNAALLAEFVDQL